MIKVFKKISDNNGYSFIEVFMTLLIISLISTILYSNSRLLVLSISQSKNNLAISYDLIKLNLVLSKECQKIETPHYLKEHLFTYNNNITTIYYYNGLEEEYISLEYTDKGIRIASKSSLIFSSTNLKGELLLYNNFIVYIDDDVEFSFPLGVFIA